MFNMTDRHDRRFHEGDFIVFSGGAYYAESIYKIGPAVRIEECMCMSASATPKARFRKDRYTYTPYTSTTFTATRVGGEYDGAQQTLTDSMSLPWRFASASESIRGLA